MAYNKYNTRNSGRYNTPGQFVSAGELVPGVGAAGSAGPLRAPLPPASAAAANQQQQQQQQQQQPLFNPTPPAPIRKTNMQQNVQQNMQQSMQTIQTQDLELKEEFKSENADGPTRPPWMKNKLQGVKKVSNKERRRRQNENLRRLLTPKNALMVLNEMLPNEQLANQFKVEPANPYYSKQHSFCADLTVAGNSYKGYGENKLTARNAAAEQAIRDLIIKKMNKVLSGDAAAAAAAAAAAPTAPAPGAGAASGSPMTTDENSEEEALPMIQLASFALHKLFSEWEYEGHKVPQLKPTAGNSLSESAADVAATPVVPAAPKVKPAKTAKDLPLNAGSMHPCMLLTFMRPHLEYRELAIEGDRPQNMMFTLGVEVDGATYVGKASNKKEARKLAAKAACSALFGVAFDDHPSSNTPVLAKME